MGEQTEYLFDLFVSYVDADRAWVEGYLLDALTRAGVRVHSREAFAPGAPWLTEFERAIQESKRTVLVLSSAYLTDNLGEFVDLLAQSYGQQIQQWPVIPLLVEPLELPPRLAMLVPLDATDPEQWPSVIQKLCAAVQRPVPGPARPPPCPYPGMRPFSQDDHKRFFGRDQEIQQLLQRLHTHPFLAVIGPSGCGKSSLIAAGLIPVLRKSTLFGPGRWVVRTLRPGEWPMAALAAALGHDPEDAQQAVSRLLEAEPDGRLLLVVDQFEEVFTLARSGTDAFQQALLRLSKVACCSVVLAARADFYAELMATPLWAEIRARRVEILPLDENNLRTAIMRPARDAGVSIEPALIEQLIRHSVGEPGALPLLQETLVLLWQRLERRYLPLRAYEALGRDGRTGLQVAMALHADDALADLNDQQREMARRFLLRLTQFGEGRVDTRRQQRVAQLYAHADDPDLFERTLQHLAEKRLLTLSGNKEADSRTVDIAHEALISGWPTLQGWLTEQREVEQARRRLEAKAREWERLGKKGGLLDHVELREARRWRTGPDAGDLGALEMTFIQASLCAHRRRLALRVLAGCLAVALLFVIAAALREIRRVRSPWQPLTGFPGDPVFAIVRTDESRPTFLVGTDALGVGRSQDGVTWALYREGLPTMESDKDAAEPELRGVGPLALDPLDPRRVFAWVSENGVYRSVDGGKSWQAANDGLPLDQDARELDAYGSLVVAALKRYDVYTLYASVNDGAGWEPVGGAGQAPLDKVYTARIARDGQRVYAGAEDGLYSSAIGPPWDWVQVVPGKPVVRIVRKAGTATGLYVSTFDFDRGEAEIYDWEHGAGLGYGARPLATVDNNALALAPHPDPDASVALYALLQDGEVIVVRKDGQTQSLHKHPGWGLTLMAATHPSTGDTWLLLGHQDGLLEYQVVLDQAPP